MNQVKVRFAPSPTGYLHVGNCRTALINWLCAKHMGGTFLLRLDDTDQERSQEIYEQGIYTDLAWLGITYDETARQSTRLERYASVADQLKASGRLYPCYETKEELAFKRKRQLGQGKPPLYDREALSLSPEEIKAFESEGRRPHWRLKLTDNAVEWDDLVRGPTHFEGDKLSDPVLVRADGLPLYTLASVVDDIDMDVSHIIRGEDHVANTAVQIELIRALGEDPQRFHFAHLPLLADQCGEGLSKRLGSLSVQDLQGEGFLPMALNNLLARIGTSNPVEHFADLQPLVDSFSFKHFSRGTPKFNPVELEMLNTKLLHELPFDQVKPYLEKWPHITPDFWENVKGNLSAIAEVEEWYQVCRGDVPTAVEADDLPFIKQALDVLPELWGEGAWAQWLPEIKEVTGRKGKGLFMPLRQALTGQTHGPELSKIVHLMGQEKVVERLTNALASVG